MGLVKFAARLKQLDEEEKEREEKRREEERRRQEAERERAEKRAHIEAEQERVDLLIQQAEDWQTSQMIRDFIEAAKRKQESQHEIIVPDGEFEVWVDWATQQADRLDPLREGVNVLKKLLKKGLNPNDQENGGCSTIQGCLTRMSWALRVRPWEQEPESGNIDTRMHVIT